jgi:hypothetical protein
MDRAFDSALVRFDVECALPCAPHPLVRETVGGYSINAMTRRFPSLRLLPRRARCLFQGAETRVASQHAGAIVTCSGADRPSPCRAFAGDLESAPGENRCNRCTPDPLLTQDLITTANDLTDSGGVRRCATRKRFTFCAKGLQRQEAVNQLPGRRSLSILNIGPFISLDSLVACIALSALRLSARERYCLAAAFGVCDGLATYLSAMPEAGVLALPILAVCLMLVLTCGSHGACGGGLSFDFRLSFRRRWLIVLPLALSIDNLLGSAPSSAAFTCGVGSMAWALLGLQLGSKARFSRWLTH